MQDIARRENWYTVVSTRSCCAAPKYHAELSDFQSLCRRLEQFSRWHIDAIACWLVGLCCIRRIHPRFPVKKGIVTHTSHRSPPPAFPCARRRRSRASRRPSRTRHPTSPFRTCCPMLWRANKFSSSSNNNNGHLHHRATGLGAGGRGREAVAVAGAAGGAARRSTALEGGRKEGVRPCGGRGGFAACLAIWCAPRSRFGAKSIRLDSHAYRRHLCLFAQVCSVLIRLCGPPCPGSQLLVAVFFMAATNPQRMQVALMPQGVLLPLGVFEKGCPAHSLLLSSDQGVVRPHGGHDRARAGSRKICCCTSLMAVNIKKVCIQGAMSFFV